MFLFWVILLPEFFIDGFHSEFLQTSVIKAWSSKALNSCLTWTMKRKSLNSVQLATYLWWHPCRHLWPVNWSHKFARLSCASIYLHHIMEKVTLMTEEPGTSLSAHRVWFSWRQTAGKGGHGYNTAAWHHTNVKREAVRGLSMLCVALSMWQINAILMQTSCTTATKGATEKNPTTLRKTRQEALMYFVRNN